MQVILGLAALIALILIYFCLPETIHPGLAGYENPTRSTAGRIVILNPFTSLNLLLSPVVLLSVSPLPNFRTLGFISK